MLDPGKWFVVAACALILAACVSPIEPSPAPQNDIGMRLAGWAAGRVGSDDDETLRVEGCAVFAADGFTCARPLTFDDPVRIASISKLVVAIGAMKLAEDGVIDLDADISRYLGFSLRNPAFPDTPITLRQLFAHVASLRDADNYVVPLGERLRDELARADHWDATHRPGTFFTYSNLGLVIVATAMEGATGERFDRLMARLVLRPLGLAATFNWSGATPQTAARAAALYQTSTEDGVWHPDGRWNVKLDDRGGALPDCVAPVRADGVACDLDVVPPGVNAGPFSPQGGLRISLRELLTIGRLLAGKGAVDGVRLLNPDTVDDFLAPVWRAEPDFANGNTDRGTMCGYGSGIHLLGVPIAGCDGLFADGRARFGHAAEAYGLLGGLWIDPATGVVVAYFATGTSADPLLLRKNGEGFTTLEHWLVDRAQE